MSIATVITEGYGSFGSISLVILNGYQAGIQTNTHLGGDDAWHPKEVEGYRKRMKRIADALARREAEKIEQIKLLRNQLRGIEDEQEAIEDAPVTDGALGVKEPDRPIPDNQRELQLRIEMLANEALLIGEQIRQQQRQMREEDDIQALLLLL